MDIKNEPGTRRGTEAQSMARVMHEQDKGRRANLLEAHLAEFGLALADQPDPEPGAQYAKHASHRAGGR